MVCSRVPTEVHCSDGQNRLFPTSDPVHSVAFRSDPLSSDVFLTTGFRSGFHRKNSVKFRRISARNSSEIDGTNGNRSELVRRSPDRNPVVKKSSELNGTDRFRCTLLDLGILQRYTNISGRLRPYTKKYWAVTTENARIRSYTTPYTIVYDCIRSP